jgi:hypothetical protein
MSKAVKDDVEGAPYNAPFAKLLLQLVSAFALLRHILERQEQL